MRSFLCNENKLKEFHEMIEELTQTIRDNIMFQSTIKSIDELTEVIDSIGGSIEWTDSDLSGYVSRIGKRFILYAMPIAPQCKFSEYHINNTIFETLKLLGKVYLVMRYGMDENFYMSFNELEPVDGIEEASNNVLIYDESIDYFSKCFLMPKNLFLEQINKHKVCGKINTYEISKFFHVNMEEVGERGRDLGYFVPNY